MLIKACLFLFVLSPMIALAGPVDQLKECQSVKDAKKRLACFDDAVKLVVAFEAGRQEMEAASKESTRVREESERAQKVADEAKRREEKERVQRTAEDAAAREAITAILKLQSRTSTGVSHGDYASVLSDAKLAVRQFQSSPSSSRRPQLSAKLIEIVSTFEDANGVWAVKAKFARRNIYPDEVLADFDPMFPELIGKYPTVRAAVRNNSGYVHYATVISLIWGVASEKIAEAEKLFANEVS